MRGAYVKELDQLAGGDVVSGRSAAGVDTGMSPEYIQPHG